MDSNQSSQSTLRYVSSFRELEVYRRQRQLSQAVFSLSKTFPKDERYSLTDQVRRSTRAIGAQIAEAWAKRLYPKHFISKLSDADGENSETQHWISEAHDCAYLSLEDTRRLLGWCAEIGRMLGAMMRKAESFASTDYTLREDPPTYLMETDELEN